MEASDPVMAADGSARPHHRECSRELETVFGTIAGRRSGHGDRRKETLLPIGASSLGLRMLAAEEAAKNSFDEAVATLAMYTGAKVPKRQLEELAVRAAHDLRSFYVGRRADWDAAAEWREAPLQRTVRAVAFEVAEGIG